jgi:hypothetical protein
VLEGMLRSNRAICEDYKSAAAVRPVLIERQPPSMPEMAAMQPPLAVPAIVRIETRPPPLAAVSSPVPAPETGAAAPAAVAADEAAQPTLAAAQAQPEAAAPASETKSRPAAAAPETPAVVMEAGDSLTITFGGGRSDQAVLAQLHAALADWRQSVDQPAAADQPAQP